MTTHKQTRKSRCDSIFGSPSDLPTNLLPTVGDICRYFVFLKDKPNSANSTIITKITQDVAALWTKASIPTVQHRTIELRIHKVISKGSQLKRSRTSSVLQKQFTSTFCDLFDICSCTCKLTRDTTFKNVVGHCSCPRDKKVPSHELPFLIDQRTTRQMYIGGVDLAMTMNLRQNLKRKHDEQLRIEHFKESKLSKQPPEGMQACSSGYNEDNICESNQDEEVTLTSDEGSDTVSRFAESDSETSDKSDTEFASTTQMRMPLPNLVREADRFGISDRATAAIATAVLADFGLVTNYDRSNVIDKSKVRRERKKMRENLRYENTTSDTANDFTSVYFDGRKDETLMRKREGEKWYSNVTKEEHYVLISEPNSIYLGHVSPKSSKGKDISECILSKMEEVGIKSAVRVVGCDSTNVNTGVKGGVIQYMENALGHSLLWCICLLHTNELPLRHLFQTLDGPTTGDKTFSGCIGRLLHSCEQMPVVHFNPIADGEDLPGIPFENLSRDQKYLYQIVKSIRQGSVTSDLSHQKPGHLHHSRWLTLANRVCRLYVANDNPSKNLKMITHFIVTHYSVNWFSIKCKPLLCDGPKHVYQAVRQLKYLPPEVADIVKPYILRNAYYAHPEHMLLALLTDPDKCNRDKAIQIILEIRRNTPLTPSQIRQFKIPEINLNPKTWVDLINWNTAVMTEPSVISNLTNKQILEISDRPLRIPSYPNHTQSVERYVKLVTDASRTVYGSDSRDGFIKARVSSRYLMPQFDTKRQFATVPE